MLMVATGFAWCGGRALRRRNSPLLFSIGVRDRAAVPGLRHLAGARVPRRARRVAHRAPAAGRRVHRRARHLRARRPARHQHQGHRQRRARQPRSRSSTRRGSPSAFDTASAGVGAVIIARVVALIVRAPRDAPPVARDAAAPVLLTGLVCLSFVSRSASPSGRRASPRSPTASPRSFASLAFLALPFAYLLGPAAQPLRARRHASATCSARSARARRCATRWPTRWATRRCGSSTGPGRWVDREGRPVELPRARA